MLIHEPVGIRRFLEREPMRDELLQAQPGQQIENRLHPSAAVPTWAEIRAHTPNLRGTEPYPSPMETFTQREGNGLRAVPGSHDNGPLDHDGSYCGLKGSP